jgi:hypothetical protein
MRLKTLSAFFRQTYVKLAGNHKYFMTRKLFVGKKKMGEMVRTLVAEHDEL